MSEIHQYAWLETGDAYYAALLEAISSARESIRLESYIYAAGQPGDAIRDALLAAVRRGVKTRVLVDAFGSMELPEDYWAGLVAAGGQCKVFNPLTLNRIAFRNHRKLLVCDSHTAFVGGFNVTGDEAGDGVSHGWRDIGLRMDGSIAAELEMTFDRMFELAEFRHKRLLRLRRRLFCRWKQPQSWPSQCVLASEPGGWNNPVKRAILSDLKKARNILIISAYFLPSRQIVRTLRRVARRGGDVRIITAGKTDVELARYAGRSLFHRLLHAKVRVFEYDAQVLHSKLIVADDAVYVGSANMDNRSFNINYELLVRIENQQMAAEARRIFESYLPHCREIEHDSWTRSRNVWEKIVEHFAHFVVARLDTYIARKGLFRLR